MHKLFLLFCCLVVLHQASGLDAEAFSKDSKVMQNFLACILETGECTKEEDTYRLGIPDAVKTNCGKCDPGTKDFFIKTTRFIVQKHPDQWKKLTAKYDPDGKYEQGLLHFIGIKS